MKKKAMLAAFSIAVVMSLTACGASEDVPEADNVEEAAVEEAAVEEAVVEGVAVEDDATTDSDAPDSAETDSVEKAPFDVGFMTFYLPEGWEMDEERSMSYFYVFCPDGDAENASKFIMVQEDFGDDGLNGSAVLADGANVEDYFMNAGVEVENGIAEDIGATVLGERTAKVTLSLAIEDGNHAEVTYYASCAEGDDWYYVVFSAAEVGESAEDAVEMLFDTAVRTDGAISVSEKSMSFERISFELPEGWEEDESLREDNAIVFAPGGDAEAAGGDFSIRYFANTTGWVDEWLTDAEEKARAIEGDGISACTIEEVDTTFMGRVARMEMIDDGVMDDKESSYVTIAYYAEYARGLYIISLSYPLEEGASADAEIAEQVKAADEMFWETGQAR